jgi:hypothetical protein
LVRQDASAFAVGADTQGTPPDGGDDNDKSDKQKKGKPERNTDQNKRVKDAAREVGLNGQQRRLLGEIIERDSRQGGANYTYQDIKAVAEEILAGRSHY